MSGERSARAARWSPEEDAALRELWAEHASTWDGWSEALPGRTAGAIMQSWLGRWSECSRGA